MDKEQAAADAAKKERAKKLQDKLNAANTRKQKKKKK